MGEICVYESQETAEDIANMLLPKTEILYAEITLRNKIKEVRDV